MINVRFLVIEYLYDKITRSRIIFNTPQKKIAQMINIEIIMGDNTKNGIELQQMCFLAFFHLINF